jgi:hypothetical protein
MPAAAVVVAAVVEFSGAAAVIGAAVEGVVGAGIIADVATGAIIGAGSGAISSAVQGGDIAQGALVGAVTQGVGAGVSNVLGGVLSLPGAGGYGPQLATGSAGLDYGIAKGLGGLASGAAGAALTGGDPLRAGLLGGVTGLVTGYAKPTFGLSNMESSALGGALSYGLGQAFAPDTATKNAVTASPGATTYSQPTITGKTSTQTSTAPLGGALLASPTLGYTPGSSFLGGTDSSKPSQNVWNQASLKEGAQVGPSSDGSQS